jgi:toxin CcdB
VTAQFDVYRNPDRASAREIPYLLVLQADALRHLNTRVAAPLVSPRKIALFEQLMPEVEVNGARLVADMTNLGTIPVRELKDFVVRLQHHRERFIAALDLVFTGI